MRFRRVNYVVLPIARLLMREDQARLASMDGYLSIVVMHEISHGLGPAFARTAAGKQSITEALGPIYSPLEEAKADVVGLFAMEWLMSHGVLPKAHGRAQMMEFNYLTEHGAGLAVTPPRPAPAPGGPIG